AAGDPLPQQLPQLVDAGLADGAMQPAHFDGSRWIGGGRRQPRQLRMLHEERHAALDGRLEAGPESARGRRPAGKLALAPRGFVGEEPAVEIELVFEVLVEAALRNARAPRNLRQRRLRVSAVGEFGDRLPHQAVTAPRGEPKEGRLRHATAQSYDR